MAPTHAAARMLGKDAITLHEARGATSRQKWDKESLALTGDAFTKARQRWEPKQVIALGKLSMVPPEVYHGASLRATIARQSLLHLGVRDYMSKRYGKMFLRIHLGAFLQPRPAQRRSLCA